MEEQEEVVEQLVEQQPEAQQEEQKQTAASRVNDVDKNWQRANEIMNYQQRQIEELNKRLFDQNVTKAPVPVEEVDEFDKLPGDELLTIDQARKIAEKQAKRVARQTYEEIRKEDELNAQKTAQANKAAEFQRKLSQLDSLEEDMRSKHADYDAITESYAIPLMNKNPAYKQLVMEAENPAEEAYILGQMLARRNGVKAPIKTDPKAERILKNTSRPLSGNSTGAPLKGQSDHAQLKPGQDIWEMSQKFARGAI